MNSRHSNLTRHIFKEKAKTIKEALEIKHFEHAGYVWLGMVFYGHPCVSWYISEDQKRANRASFTRNRGIFSWESHIPFYKLYNVKTTWASLPIQLPHIALWSPLIGLDWARNDSGRVINEPLAHSKPGYERLWKWRICAKIQRAYNMTNPIQLFCWKRYRNARVPNKN